MFCSAVLEPESFPPPVVTWKKRSDFTLHQNFENQPVTSLADILAQGSYHDSRDGTKSPIEFLSEEHLANIISNGRSRALGTSLDLSLFTILEENLKRENYHSGSGTASAGSSSSMDSSTSRDSPVTSRDLVDLLPLDLGDKVAAKKHPRQIARPSYPQRRRADAADAEGLKTESDCPPLPHLQSPKRPVVKRTGTPISSMSRSRDRSSNNRHFGARSDVEGIVNPLPRRSRSHDRGMPQFQRHVAVPSSRSGIAPRTTLKAAGHSCSSPTSLAYSRGG